MDDCERVIAKLEEVKEHVGERVTAVEDKVEKIATSTGEFQLKMTEVVTRLATAQETCPIHKMNGRLNDVKKKAESAEKRANAAAGAVERAVRYVRVAIGAIVVAVIGAVLDAIGIRRG